METNFNFKSQICTDRNQSERLLALGLKKETADMALVENWDWSEGDGKYFTGEYFKRPIDYVEGLRDKWIPAWSLERLFALANGEGWRAEITLRDDMYGIYYGYELHWYDDIFEGVIDWIEDDIKSRYLNRKYLEK